MKIFHTTCFRLCRHPPLTCEQIIKDEIATSCHWGQLTQPDNWAHVCDCIEINFGATKSRSNEASTRVKLNQSLNITRAKRNSRLSFLICSAIRLPVGIYSSTDKITYLTRIKSVVSVRHFVLILATRSHIIVTNGKTSFSLPWIISAVNTEQKYDPLNPFVRYWCISMSCKPGQRLQHSRRRIKPATHIDRFLIGL